MTKLFRIYLLGFFESLKNILVWSVTSLTYYLFENKWRVSSFVGIVVFFLGYVFLPDWQNFWAVKNKVANVGSRAWHVSTICDSFKNFSEEQKERFGFKNKLLRAQQKWWEANNDLFLTLTDQYYASTFGKEIYNKIDKFRRLNATLNEYVETYNSCPDDMPSPDKIGGEKDQIINMLPLTIGEYVKFYITVRLLGK